MYTRGKENSGQNGDINVRLYDSSGNHNRTIVYENILR